MNDSIVDPTFGIGNQARAVLAMLERDPDFAEYVKSSAACSSYYDVTISTRAWYNGREKGVSLCMYRPGYKGYFIVTFGEHRHSDHIFVDSWMSDLYNMNGPTVKDFTEEAYSARKTFSYGEAGKAADFIYEAMATAYKGFEKIDTTLKQAADL